MEIRQVAAGDSWKWIAQGFALFKQSPVIWIVLFLIYLLLAMALTFIPFLGPLLLNLLAPVFMAGFMLGCKAIEQGEELEINHLFAGFQHNTAQLITVGGIYLASTIVIAALAFALMGSGTVSALMSGGEETQMLMEGGKLTLTILCMMLLLMPLIMAYWFAPALVALNGLQAVEAMKLSFSACLRNLLPFLVYSLIIGLLMIVAMIPLGLGLLVMIPTMTASLYTSYKDIFNLPAAASSNIAV